MINSRNISDLLPEVAVLCQKFIAECAKQNIKVIITSTYRDNEAQNALYAQGRTINGKTTPGRIITYRKGGQSMHNFKKAFDFCIIKNSHADWKDLAGYKKCGEIAKSIGLKWGGDWVKFKEFVHCEYTK